MASPLGRYSFWRPATPRKQRRSRKARYPLRAPLRRRRLPAEAPADRLVEHGARALSSVDLLGLVLGAGSEELARRLLRDPGSLTALCQAPLGELARHPGLTLARRIRLAAALELGRRSGFPTDGRVPCFRGPQDVGPYLLSRFGNRGIEEFGILLLDSRGCLRRAEIVARGSLTGTQVHPREVFRLAAAYQAASVILFHNHPSGNPEPSEADQELTERMRKAGDIMGVPVVDHIVIGSGSWRSLDEYGRF